MVEIKESTIKGVLNILKPYKKGCDHTASSRQANLIQRNGAKKLATEIGKVIEDIENQI